MKHDKQILNEYAGKVLEQVSILMEQWPPYLQARDQLWEMLERSESSCKSAEERQTLLMDYEMAVILAAYFMGMHDAKTMECSIMNLEKVLELLDSFSPLKSQNYNC